MTSTSSEWAVMNTNVDTDTETAGGLVRTTMHRGRQINIPEEAF